MKRTKEYVTKLEKTNPIRNRLNLISRYPAGKNRVKDAVCNVFKIHPSDNALKTQTSLRPGQVPVASCQLEIQCDVFMLFKIPPRS